MSDEQDETKTEKIVYKTTIVIASLVVIAFILLSPLALIWAVNGLFNLNIAYTFLNWLYAFVIVVMLKAGDMTK